MRFEPAGATAYWTKRLAIAAAILFAAIGPRGAAAQGPDVAISLNLNAMVTAWRNWAPGNTNQGILLIRQNGVDAAEDYYRAPGAPLVSPWTADTNWNVASLSKAIRATCLMRLIDTGATIGGSPLALG